MIATLAFEPIFLDLARGKRPQRLCVETHKLDPDLAALVREIKAVEGEAVAEPLLFRLVEMVGYGIIAACVAGLASGVATAFA